MATIKPFARPGFTMFNNCILDHIMPDLSANSWKVLCAAIRKTIGWQDEETESGRRDMEVISFRHLGQEHAAGLLPGQCIRHQRPKRVRQGLAGEPPAHDRRANASGDRGASGRSTICGGYVIA